MLYALLGDRDAFTREEHRALESFKHTVFTPSYLAAAHAYLGDDERAAELLRRSVREGGITPFWSLIFGLMSPTTPESDAFAPFLDEYEAEERRLRENY